MATYDTRTTSTYEIEDAIVEGALAPGITSTEFLANCGSIDAAVAEIVDWYTISDGRDAEFLDHDGEALRIEKYARRYFDRLATN